MGMNKNLENIIKMNRIILNKNSFTNQMDQHLSKEEIEDYLINTSQLNYDWFLNNTNATIVFDVDWEKLSNERLIKDIIE